MIEGRVLRLGRTRKMSDLSVGGVRLFFLRKMQNWPNWDTSKNSKESSHGSRHFHLHLVSLVCLRRLLRSCETSADSVGGHDVWISSYRWGFARGGVVLVNSPDWMAIDLIGLLGVLLVCVLP